MCRSTQMCMEYTDGARARATVRSEFESEIHSDRIDSAKIREFTGDRPIRSTTGGVVNFVNTQPWQIEAIEPSERACSFFRASAFRLEAHRSSGKRTAIRKPRTWKRTDRFGRSFSDRPDRLKAETRTRKDTHERRARLRHAWANGWRGACTAGGGEAC